MTQPSFVPIVEIDQVRPAYRLRTPADWRQSRVAEVRGPDHPKGRDLGRPGPDQGYALLLAHRLFAHKVVLSEGITDEDALVGCAAVASARAGLFGRAPVGQDIELALTLFGFLGGAPDDLVAWRAPLFKAAAHQYGQRRAIVTAVPEETLRLSVSDLRGRVDEWRRPARRVVHRRLSSESARGGHPPLHGGGARAALPGRGDRPPRRPGGAFSARLPPDLAVLAPPAGGRGRGRSPGCRVRPTRLLGDSPPVTASRTTAPTSWWRM